MDIAVAVDRDFSKVVGHAGQCRRWLLFKAVGEDGQCPTAPERVVLEKEQVWHHFKDDRPHPLDGIAAVLAQSAGNSYIRRMATRGAEATMTAETDPARAVADYVAHKLAPAKPRPVMGLVCKVRDLFSEH
ncbi:MAG: hypothetical protein ACPGOY_11955 [Rhodospirillaceae bacterium]